MLDKNKKLDICEDVLNVYDQLTDDEKTYSGVSIYYEWKNKGSEKKMFGHAVVSGRKLKTVGDFTEAVEERISHLRNRENLTELNVTEFQIQSIYNKELKSIIENYFDYEKGQFSTEKIQSK